MLKNRLAFTKQFEKAEQFSIFHGLFLRSFSGEKAVSSANCSLRIVQGMLVNASASIICFTCPYPIGPFSEVLFS